MIGCCTAPCLCGACWKCLLRGEKVYGNKGATTYVFFVMLLSKEDPIRKGIQVAFKENFALSAKVLWKIFTTSMAFSYLFHVNIVFPFDAFHL